MRPGGPHRQSIAGPHGSPQAVDTSEMELGALDTLLWSVPPTGFLPHCRASDAMAAETPVLLTSDPDALPHHEILMNLDGERPANFSRFERLLEIVSRDDADDRARARERFKFYRDRGYEIVRHDLAPKP